MQPIKKQTTSFTSIRSTSSNSASLPPTLRPTSQPSHTSSPQTKTRLCSSISSRPPQKFKKQLHLKFTTRTASRPGRRPTKISSKNRNSPNSTAKPPRRSKTFSIFLRRARSSQRDIRKAELSPSNNFCQSPRTPQQTSLDSLSPTSCRQSTTTTMHKTTPSSPIPARFASKLTISARSLKYSSPRFPTMARRASRLSTPASKYSTSCTTSVPSPNTSPKNSTMSSRISYSFRICRCKTSAKASRLPKPKMNCSNESSTRTISSYRYRDASTRTDCHLLRTTSPQTRSHLRRE